MSRRVDGARSCVSRIRPGARVRRSAFRRAKLRALDQIGNTGYGRGTLRFALPLGAGDCLLRTSRNPRLFATRRHVALGCCANQALAYALLSRAVASNPDIVGT
jgi:hypothetical protein